MSENAELDKLLQEGGRLYGAGHTASAAKVYRKALGIAPDNPTVRLRHATAIWHGENRTDEALTEIRALGQKYPQAVIFATEGLILNSLGQFQAAADAARRALQADPAHSSAWLNLATAIADDQTPHAIQDLQQALPKAKTPEARRDMHFAMARMLRKSGDLATAFKHTVQANAQVPPKWNIAQEQAFRDELKDVFTSDLMSEKGGQALPDDRMIFIVGMPRSGTTLLERMLVAHPDIGSAGETTAAGRLYLQYRGQVGATVDKIRHNLTPQNLNALAKAVIGDVEARLGDLRPNRIIDKMPANYLFVPLISLMLPNAKIVHMQRHPLDTGLSCFEAHFAFGLDYASRLDSLGAAYRMYADLMDHWATLPSPAIHDVCYEDLVADPEPVIRKLLSHCGMNWHPDCLAPTQSGAIKTASVAQARAGVNTQSVGRWHQHEKDLEPLIKAMGGMKWVETRAAR